MDKLTEPDVHPGTQLQLQSAQPIKVPNVTSCDTTPQHLSVTGTAVRTPAAEQNQRSVHIPDEAWQY